MKDLAILFGEHPVTMGAIALALAVIVVALYLVAPRWLRYVIYLAITIILFLALAEANGGMS